MTKSVRSRARIPGYCALCVSRCGSQAVVEDGRFVALEPDPGHPTGRALCAKGRAAPELVGHPDRLLHPLKRTRPKGDPDPGWVRIGWDEALDKTAAALRELAEKHGPESVVFTTASPSTSASGDALAWIERLRRAFGSPNEAISVELCGWGRYVATAYTYGVGVPGLYMPDLERAGCILFWGYNPNLARLAHAVATADAVARGARLIVVDPRRTGPANKADVWMRVRPGTDGALALGIAHVMIEHAWFDRDFVREWTNGPLLVRSDDGRLLRLRDIRISRADSSPGSAAGDRSLVAWNESEGRAVGYDPQSRGYASAVGSLALSGEFPVETRQGTTLCRPSFDLVRELCREYPPETVESTCGVSAREVHEAARLLWEARPVAYYAWSGVEMQSNATQIARAIGQLYALTGCLDAPGGNVLFASPSSEDVTGEELLSESQRARTLGLARRPLGPARLEHVTSGEIYRAILEDEPYPVRGLVGFGANLLLAHADSQRGREALAALDFHVHADLFMNPTAELADIVLPVAGAFEREGLKIGFEVSEEAQALMQLRPAVVEPRGESRSDMTIVFDLACRLGLGDHFWNGDTDAGLRHQLAPSGVSLETLRSNPGGVRTGVRTRHRKFAEPDDDGRPRGFATPTRKIELYSETMLVHGHPPLPTYEEPMVGPVSRPDLLPRFPLVLTCAKHTLFCESQHRQIASLRRRAPEPEVELHPAAAAEREIASGDWVHIQTPKGSVRARAKMNASLDPNVVCGQHGWWQACAEIGASGYDPFGPDGANYNAIIGHDAIDPVSGSVPHRAYLCEVRKA